MKDKFWIVVTFGLTTAATIMSSASLPSDSRFVPQLLVPVGVAAIPLAFSRRTWPAPVATLLLGVWVFLTLPSVGLLYVPALLGMGWQSLRLTQKPRLQTQQPSDKTDPGERGHET